MSHKFHQHVHVHAHLNRNEKSRDKLGLLGWLHVSARSQPVLSLIESSTPSERTDDALEPRRRTTNKTFSQVLSHSFFSSLALSLSPFASLSKDKSRSVSDR